MKIIESCSPNGDGRPKMKFNHQSRENLGLTNINQRFNLSAKSWVQLVMLPENFIDDYFARELFPAFHPSRWMAQLGKVFSTSRDLWFSFLTVWCRFKALRIPRKLDDFIILSAAIGKILFTHHLNPSKGNNLDHRQIAPVKQFRCRSTPNVC